MSDLPPLELVCFGPPTARVAGQEPPADVVWRKHLAFLIYLALSQSRTRTRDHLLALLWPDRPEGRARHSLSEAIRALRSALGADRLIARGNLLILNDTALDVDALRFDALLAEQPEKALELFRGDFLEGFALDDANGFEDWAEHQRSNYQARAASALLALAEEAIQARDFPRALAAGRRAQMMRPYAEPAVELLMRIAALSGDRTAALLEFDKFSELMERELEEMPSSQLSEFAQRIRAGWGAPEWGQQLPASAAPAPAPGLARHLDSRAGHDAPPAPDTAKRRSFRSRFGAAVTAVAAVVLVGWAAYVRTSPTDADLVPAIAVLPFRETGANGPLLGEGMVDLLSLNLDEVSNLRVVDPRVVLSHWNDSARQNTAAGDQERMLQIGRTVGARYVATGSLVKAGNAVRLTAEVYESVKGTLRGRAYVEGPADSLLSLVNGLSVELLRKSVVPARDLPPMDLSRLTTSSLPALRSYLDGEQLFRRSRWHEAAAAFSRAIEFDSMFALPYYRLGVSYSALNALYNEAWAAFGDRAAKLANRLPARYRRLMEAYGDVQNQRVPAAMRNLVDFTDRYPDDVEGWYLLGMCGRAFGNLVSFPRERAVQALRHTLELAPKFGPAYSELLEDAFWMQDSTEARRLIREFRELDSNSPDAVGFALAYDAVWGSADVRSRLAADLDAVSDDALVRAMYALVYVPDFAEQVLLLANSLTRPHRSSDAQKKGWWARGTAYFLTGRVQQARAYHMRYLEISRFRKTIVANWFLTWLLAGYSDTSRTRDLETLGESSRPVDQFIVGAVAAHERRWEVAQAEIERLRQRAAHATPDSVTARAAGGLALGLSGYEALEKGDDRLAISRIAEALDTLRAFPLWQFSDATMMLRFRLSGELVKQARAADAENYARDMFYGYQDWILTVPRELRLGQIAEAKGDLDTARHHYARFVRWWQDCDPELKPLWEEGRRALARID